MIDSSHETLNIITVFYVYHKINVVNIYIYSFSRQKILLWQQ